MRFNGLKREPKERREEKGERRKKGGKSAVAEGQRDRDSQTGKEGEVRDFGDLVVAHLVREMLYVFCSFLVFPPSFLAAAKPPRIR